MKAKIVQTEKITFLKSIIFTGSGIEAKIYTDDNALWLERHIDKHKKQNIYLDGEHLDFLFKVLKEIEHEKRN
jgi:hypothetical protein